MLVPENNPTPLPAINEADATQNDPAVKRDWRGHIVIQIILYITGAMVIIVIVQKIIAYRTLDPKDLHHHKVKACEKMSPQLHTPLDRIQKTVDPYLFHRVVQAHSDEMQMVHDILDVAQRCHEHVDGIIHEALSGAYLLIPDDGALYLKWIEKLSTARIRLSSHNSIVPQFAVAGGFIGEGLFGQGIVKTETGQSRKYTWVQFEAYPNLWLTLLPHGYSYVKYCWTGRNQGPYGTSIFSEHNPLKLAPKALVSQPAQ